MTTLLPLDDNNHPIPALRLRPDGSHKITVSDASARNAVPFREKTRVVSLYATGDVYIRTGGSSVSATSSDHFFPAFTYYDIAVGDKARGQVTHIAAIATSGSGPFSLYISEKE